jgi:folate-binding protein YgfZ
VLGLAAGQSRLSALLDAKGHVLALMRAHMTDAAVLLEMPADRVAKVKETLLFYKVAAPVRFEERTTAVVAVMGPGADAILSKAGVTAAAADDLPAGGRVVYADDGDATLAAVLSAGALPIGPACLDVLRIEDGTPWYGSDVGEDNLLHETGRLGLYHSSTKGCYIGQEVVARLEGRGGNVNKQLRGLKLAAPAGAGDRVERAGQDVGRVTTAGISPALGPIALGMIHRSAFEPGTGVSVGGQSATVVQLPFDGRIPPR